MHRFYRPLVYTSKNCYNFTVNRIGVFILVESKNHVVKKYIMDLIHKRIYNEGQLIDSETTLCERLNVSRMTVRKALDELVSEGIIYKEKGRGTFVARKPKYAEFRCGVGFTQEVKKRGMTPSSKDCTLELCEATEEIARKLNIPPREKIWKVTRVRCADGVPVVFINEYYLYSLCPDLTLDIVNQSIYAHLEKKGISFAFLDQKLEAIICPPDIANKLEILEGHPLILMSLIVYMKNGTAFNCGTEYYRTDKFTLVQSVYNN